MGILNCTPDSFFDGGQYADPGSALARAEHMIAEGADFIDVGGESTRPGSEPVDPPEQIRRTIPVIRAIRARWDGPISIDTTRSEVAGQAFGAGANWINDISGLRDDPNLAPLAAFAGAGVILMHMLGTPRDMQAAPRYSDVVTEVAAFLRERVTECRRAGVAADRIVIDPGIGFGKNLEHNLALLRNLGRLVDLGHPVLIGASRKSFIGRLLGDDRADRIEGSLAVALMAASQGASIIRVHDVGPTRRALTMWSALMTTPE